MIHFHNSNTQAAASSRAGHNYMAQGNDSRAQGFANFGGRNDLADILQQLINLVQQLLDNGFKQSDRQIGNNDPLGIKPGMGSNMQNGVMPGNGRSQSNAGNSMNNGMGPGAAGNGMSMGNAMGQNSLPQMMGNTGPLQSVQAFNTPVGAAEPGPVFSEQAYEITFAAQPGQSVSLASMLIETNDQFIAPDANGIELFDENGVPRQGDITQLLPVWDAGTEVNETVGAGDNQPMRMSGPNTGPADPDNRVRLSGAGLPPLNELIKSDLKYNDDGTFTLRLENVSGRNGTADHPLSPGILVVHDSGFNPLFDNNQPDRGLGLEAIAEDGDPSQLLANLQAQINAATD